MVQERKALEVNGAGGRNFKESISRAIKACEASGNNASEHFVQAAKTSPMPNGGAKEIPDFQLSRYACYLIAMKGVRKK